MDTHKTKPWHSLREFLKEYVIIVVGVLTALAFEQGVEWLHWRGQAEAAREVFRRDNLGLIQWIGQIDATGVCVERRLNELQDILDKAEMSGRLPPLGDLGKPPTPSWSIRGWDEAVSGGVLPHLRPGEGALYAGMHSATVFLADMRDSSVAQWATLTAMTGPGRRLSESEAANLRAALQRARIDAVRERGTADWLGRMVLEARLISRPHVQAAWRRAADRAARDEPICRPIGSPRGPNSFPALAAPPAPPELSNDDTLSPSRGTAAK